MTRRATARFKVTSWDQESYAGEPENGPALGTAVVGKTYTGDLAGRGLARLLMCQADPSTPAADAGYVASEQIVGTLGRRKGSFVIQHWGVAAAGSKPRTDGHVVPGSGTGELAGLAGSVRIAVDADGQHTLTLDYTLP